MAKQIYIDSNGNEVLVSGTITTDNNLPHYTGTPTAGTTAEAIASKADKTQTATFIPETGVQVMHISTGVTDKQGCITGEIRFTQTANSWKDLGTLSVKPSDICQVCGVHTGTGAFLGIVRLQPTTGKLQVYPVINISNDAVGFSISFITA